MNEYRTYYFHSNSNPEKAANEAHKDIRSKGRKIELTHFVVFNSKPPREKIDHLIRTIQQTEDITCASRLVHKVKDGRMISKLAVGFFAPIEGKRYLSSLIYLQFGNIDFRITDPKEKPKSTKEQEGFTQTLKDKTQHFRGQKDRKENGEIRKLIALNYKLIKKKFERGFSTAEIADEVGLSVSGFTNNIQKHFPELNEIRTSLFDEVRKRVNRENLAKRSERKVSAYLIENRVKGREEEVRKLIEAGATFIYIAKLFKADHNRMANYIKSHPEFYPPHLIAKMKRGRKFVIPE